MGGGGVVGGFIGCMDGVGGWRVHGLGSGGWLVGGFMNWMGVWWCG